MISPHEEESHLCQSTHHSASANKKVSLCSSNHVDCRKESILVVGALHFLGAGLVSHLASIRTKVMAVADYNDIIHDRHGLMWYRDAMLQDQHGVYVHLADLTNQTQVEHILRLEGNFSKVVYVPPGLDITVADLSKPGGERYWDADELLADALTQLVTILEVLQRKSPCTQVLLATRSRKVEEEAVSSRDSPLMAWMETLELVLSTYHNLYGTSVSVFRVHGVYGPGSPVVLQQHLCGGLKVQDWYGCFWYIDRVVELLVKAMKLDKECQLVELGVREHMEDRKDGLLKSWQWVKSYVKSINTRKSDGENDIIFTSYFTSSEDPQRKERKSSNSFRYMENFYWSLKEMKMKAIIFHDGLDQSFQDRVHSHYPNATFFKVDSLHGRSTNDARFYAYYEYLRKHSNMTKVILTDMADVVFQRNPFQLMSVLGDLLYVGSDDDTFPNVQSMPWIKEGVDNCFSVQERDKLGHLMEMEVIYNAGIIGGSRETLLSALMMIVSYLDKANPEMNCNTPVLNHVVHKHFFGGEVFEGFPLNSQFRRRQVGPRGVYIIHK